MTDRHARNYVDKFLRMKSLSDDEKIYFVSEYHDKWLLNAYGCWWDVDKKKWFSAFDNSYLDLLLVEFQIDDITSDKAKAFARDVLDKTNEIGGNDYEQHCI